MSYRRKTGVALATASILTLSGCVGALLGGGKPDALYSFGMSQSGPQQLETTLPRRILAVPTPRFSPATGGDRVLTSQGNAKSYIKDMRWVTAAPALYMASIETTIANRAPDIAILSRGGAGRADAVLTVTIDNFEAVYSAGAPSLPTVHIDGSAVLFDQVKKRIIGRYVISGSHPANANSGSAIAEAFEAMTRDSIIRLVDWANVSMPVPNKAMPSLADQSQTMTY